MRDRPKLDIEAIAEASRQAYADAAQTTLRDQFAMAALTGMLANSNTKGDISGLQAHLPDMAYGFADAMLAAREAK